MQLHNEINKEPWLPSYQHHQQNFYILLTSLNLGGAEKIVSDQLWANHYSKFPQKITLIVIYEKEKEHSIPPGVNVVRLHNHIKNGELLFKQIAYEQSPLVCHLINDEIANYLFDLGLYLHFVVHNDKRAWPNDPSTYNHKQTISIVAVAQYVEKQLREVVHSNPIYTFRHHISGHQFYFNKKIRDEKRLQLKISDDDIVIGMIGRICQQKNYFFALDLLCHLVSINPRYKLIIIGGFEPKFYDLYMKLLQKINFLKLHQHVIIPGFQTNANQWMNVFDIGLNTSYFEGLSMATQEFMRNGLPMVLSKVSGQPEIIDLSSQLHFFDLPLQLDTPNTNVFDLYFDSSEETEEIQQQFSLYLDQVEIVADIIDNIDLKRISFSDEVLQEHSFLCYGSHNMWNTLHLIRPFGVKNSINPVFITSDLNAGGAQRSLVNLLKQFKSQDTSIPLVLLNQSNQQQFFTEVIDSHIDYYLCHQSNDVFDICSNLFTYFHDNKVNRIILWNVDAKMKLLISKFYSHYIDIIDVSPGDYIFNEMASESIFQNALYFHKENYFYHLHQFVSKYHNPLLFNGNILLKNNIKTVPNGVFIPEHNIGIKKAFPFKMLVCGRITPSKHLETIFSAWREFIHKYPNEKVVLDLYGSVEPCYVDYYNKLQEDFSDLIEKEVIVWKGHHDNPPSIMKHYHAIIVLGTHQGSPNVVLEAAACCLPIIANDSGGTKEIINENTGWLLPEKIDTLALYEALVELYFNYDLAWKKAVQCHQHVADVFSMEKMTQSYKEIIFE